MATNNNLHDFLLDVASAIRQKTGDANPINPQEFSNKIKNLSISSGGASLAELTGLTPKYYKINKIYDYSGRSTTVNNYMTFMYTGSLIVHPDGLIISNLLASMSQITSVPDGLYILDYQELAPAILEQLGLSSHEDYLEIFYSEWPEARGSVVEVTEEEFFEAMRNAASNL